MVHFEYKKQELFVKNCDLRYKNTFQMPQTSHATNNDYQADITDNCVYFV